jgi:HlyD family secretion protein
MANKKKNRRIYIIVGILAILLISGAIARRAGWIGDKNRIEVETSKSEIRTIFARVTESGIIEPTIDVPVAPDVSGEVVYIAVKEGMSVSKGDLLVTIRPDEYQALVDQAEASLNQVKAAQMQAKASMSQARANLMQDSISLERTRKLFEDKVVSQQEMETAQLNYNVSRSQFVAAQHNVDAAYYQVQNAQASLKQARQNLDRTNIYASMDGTITELNVELGQRVVGTRQMAGTDILKIADLSSMEVVVEVNENDIVHVNLGDSARIEVDAFPDRQFYGEVSEIAYSAVASATGVSDQVTNFEVKVRITPSSYLETSSALKDIPVKEQSPFRPGMTALVDIFTRSVQDAISVPIQAVTLSKEMPGDSAATPGSPQEVVFVVEADSVREVPVSTGISDDTYIEVKDGLADGVEVVTGPYTVLTKRLKNGMAVRVREEESTE